MDWDEMNRPVIEEFRANEAAWLTRRSAGTSRASPCCCSTTTGAKTGAARLTPLMYLDEDGHRYVFASKGGAPDSPDWYHNLVANPAVTVEVGTTSYPAAASVITGAERDRIYSEQVRTAGRSSGSTSRRRRARSRSSS